MLIIFGILIGAFIANVIDCNVEDQNLIAPMMLFVSMGISVSTILIGIIVGFSLISQTKKFARIDKIDLITLQENKNNVVTRSHTKLSIYLVSFCMTAFALSMTGSNLSNLLTLSLTLALFVLISQEYIRKGSKDGPATLYVVIVLVIILFAAFLTVNRVNTLNIFIFFYGFITIPNYISPSQSFTTDNRENVIGGAAFGVSTKGSIANGIVLAQALIAGSQKDSIGTLINTYVSEDIVVRLLIVATVVTVMMVFSRTKEYSNYFKSVKPIITDNTNKTNNKSALFSIAFGAFIGVTQYNPYVFIVIVLSGIACTYILRNNDVLRSLSVPSLLLTGLFIA